VPLRSTNNAVLWLKPTSIVAKVGIGRNQRLCMELQVAQELCALGAPVVCPAPDLPAMVHSGCGLDVTFWQYHPQDAAGRTAPERVAPALRRLHLALARISPGLRSLLPTYLRELSYVRALLMDRASLTALPQADRDLLIETFERLRVELLALAPAGSHLVIHGAPHAYNVLLVADEPRFIDFETVCTGPPEWDMAHLDPQAERHYGPALHTRLLWACRGMASVKTAVLCWADVNRGDLRDHAEWHLAHVRDSVAPHTVSPCVP
jgi:hypothetical protein